MRLLLVEDDAMIGPALKKGLGLHGFAAELVANGEDALHSLATEVFDLVVLDVNLPDMSGFEVLAAMRGVCKNARPPVLLLTAREGTENKVKGLDSGADDYMTKPFDMLELAARVRALLRRSGKVEADNVLRAGDVELDLSKNMLRKGGNTIVPTANELKVLALLFERPGRLVSKAQMEDVLYGWEGEVDSNTVEVTIYNLRKKLGRDFIRTMRGLGYMVQS